MRSSVTFGRIAGIEIGIHYSWLLIAGLKREPDSALDEFLIAAVGPATSFALAGAFWGGTLLLPDGTPAHAVFGYLAFANALLGGFNLLPGFPLDGGRVLRAVVWGATRSLRRGTQVASYVGQGIGFLLVLVGISQLLGGAVLNGLWTAVIGHFLSGAAASARHQQALRESLQDLRAEDVMQRAPATADGTTSVQEFLYLHVLRHGRRALPVVEQGRLTGIVTVTDAKDVPQPAWALTSVAEIMTRTPLKTVTPETRLDRALDLLAEHSLNQLPVVEGDGRLAGLLTRADVLRVIQLRRTLGVPDLLPRDAAVVAELAYSGPILLLRANHRRPLPIRDESVRTRSAARTGTSATPQADGGTGRSPHQREHDAHRGQDEERARPP